jgi:hypothetical protein
VCDCVLCKNCFPSPTQPMIHMSIKGVLCMRAQIIGHNSKLRRISKSSWEKNLATKHKPKAVFEVQFIKVYTCCFVFLKKRMLYLPWSSIPRIFLLILMWLIHMCSQKLVSEWGFINCIARIEVFQENFLFGLMVCLSVLVVILSRKL